MQSLRKLLLLKPFSLHKVCRQISFALHELLKSNAANIHLQADWSAILTLMEVVGAGSRPPVIRGAAATASTESNTPPQIRKWKMVPEQIHFPF